MSPLILIMVNILIPTTVFKTFDHLCHHLEEGEGDHFLGHVDHLVEDDCDRAVVVLDLADRGCVEVVLDGDHAEVILDNRQQAGGY